MGAAGLLRVHRFRAANNSGIRFTAILIHMKKMTFLFATLLAFLPQSSDAAGFTLGTEQINLDGYSLRCDSFNSSDTNRSTDGHYDSAKAGDGCYVGVARGIFGSGHGGSASIWGYLDSQVPF